MRLINDANDPVLIGMITDLEDFKSTNKIVNNLNRDLIDSGFNQYQYQTVCQGNKIYVKRMEVL